MRTSTCPTLFHTEDSHEKHGTHVSTETQQYPRLPESAGSRTHNTAHAWQHSMRHIPARVF